MSDRREKLAEAIAAELDEHGYEDDDEKRGQVAWHFAEAVVAALQLTPERERRRTCTCGHGEIDHAMYGDRSCGANKGSRHTTCPCEKWELRERSRLVSPWEPVGQEQQQ